MADMWRLLFGGAALLAGLLFFFLFRGAGTGEQQSDHGADELGAQSDADTRRAVSTAPLALRMRGQDSDSSEATGAGQHAELSMSAAFATEAPGDVALVSEREGMIRGVISDLVERKVGAATVARLECREQHCVLQLGGEDTSALVELIGALQDERGFLGKCESMMLATEGDTYAVYLRFADGASGPQSPTP